ncbi:MAG: Spy/CpxP family protein refolding chaperone [Gammaproteobacteria bacterium]
MKRKLRIARWPVMAALCAASWTAGVSAQAVDDADSGIDTDRMIEETLQERTNPGLAYGFGPCPYGGGYGMGMMGPGMMGGPGMGYGMGRGMGMMGPGMMGPGTGYGMGYGPGMRGPWGGGMMGPMGGFAMLDLSDQQQQEIDKIRQETFRKHFDLRQQIFNERQNLRRLLLQDKPDPKAVGAEYDKIAQLRRQMIESRVEAQNRMEAVLTQEQRQQLQQSRRMMRGYGPPWGAW